MNESKISENKAILSLEMYDKFKEMEKAVNESKFIFTSNWNGSFYAMKESEVIDKLQNENISLKKEIEELKYPNNEKTLFEINNMNLFSLIMWKLKN